MIKINNIAKSFGQIKALDDISINMSKGKLTIIAGADGAGKSTIFKIILGLLKKDSGSIFLNNIDIESDYSKITSICGYMPEKFSLYQDLTVEENLNFFADIRNVPKKRREELKSRLLENTGMAGFKKRQAGALSGGMKQKLSLATILLSSPEIIILDEPTTGVDPLSRIEFFNIIDSLKDEGKTIVISTPYLDEAEKGDYIVFMKNGKNIKSDTIENLKANQGFKIFNIIPKGNIFDILLKLKSEEKHNKRAFIKGEYIKYIANMSTEASELSFIPHLSIEREEPRLEDIYLYYERLYTNKNKTE
jgi:ABC-2 type transport system ATP-binding protein